MKNAREIAEEILGRAGKFAFYVMPGDATREDAIAACESAILNARQEAFEEAANLSESIYNESAHGIEEIQHIASCAIADKIRALAEKEKEI